MFIKRGLPPGLIVDRRNNLRSSWSKQRRHYPRVRLEFEGFWSSTRRMLFAKGNNLSVHGVFLVSPAPEQPGTKGTLWLQLPNHPTMLRIPAKVIWTNENTYRGPLGMGLSFEGLLPWQLELIASCLFLCGGTEAIMASEPDADNQQLGIDLKKLQIKFSWLYNSNQDTVEACKNYLYNLNGFPHTWGKA